MSLGNYDKFGKNNPNYKYGLSTVNGKITKLYQVWIDMKRRCHAPKHARYKNYGLRGITVCIEWRMEYKAFYDWAQNNGYQEGLTIDRIDNDGNYCPENCRWVTNAENCRNTRRTKLNHEIVKNIIEDYQSNKYTQVEIARKYNTSPQQVNDIIKGKIWRVL